jgi:hypothetical protein
MPDVIIYPFVMNNIITEYVLILDFCYEGFQPQIFSVYLFFSGHARFTHTGEIKVVVEYKHRPHIRLREKFLSFLTEYVILSSRIVNPVPYLVTEVVMKTNLVIY